MGLLANVRYVYDVIRHYSSTVDFKNFDKATEYVVANEDFVRKCFSLFTGTRSLDGKVDGSTLTVGEPYRGVDDEFVNGVFKKTEGSSSSTPPNFFWWFGLLKSFTQIPVDVWSSKLPMAFDSYYSYRGFWSPHWIVASSGGKAWFNRDSAGNPFAVSRNASYNLPYKNNNIWVTMSVGAIGSTTEEGAQLFAGENEALRVATLWKGTINFNSTSLNISTTRALNYVITTGSTVGKGSWGGWPRGGVTSGMFIEDYPASSILSNCLKSEPPFVTILAVTFEEASADPSDDSLRNYIYGVASVVFPRVYYNVGYDESVSSFSSDKRLMFAYSQAHLYFFGYSQLPDGNQGSLWFYGVDLWGELYMKNSAAQLVYNYPLVDPYPNPPTWKSMVSWIFSFTGSDIAKPSLLVSRSPWARDANTALFSRPSYAVTDTVIKYHFSFLRINYELSADSLEVPSTIHTPLDRWFGGFFSTYSISGSSVIANFATTIQAQSVIGVPFQYSTATFFRSNKGTALLVPRYSGGFLRFNFYWLGTGSPYSDGSYTTTIKSSGIVQLRFHCFSPFDAVRRFLVILYRGNDYNSFSCEYHIASGGTWQRSRVFGWQLPLVEGVVSPYWFGAGGMYPAESLWGFWLSRPVRVPDGYVCLVLVMTRILLLGAVTHTWRVFQFPLANPNSSVRWNPVIFGEELRGYLIYQDSEEVDSSVFLSPAWDLENFDAVGPNSVNQDYRRGSPV
jgi:hypothetical protein